MLSIYYNSHHSEMAFQFHPSKIQTTRVFFLKLGLTLPEIPEGWAGGVHLLSPPDTAEPGWRRWPAGRPSWAHLHPAPSRPASARPCGAPTPLHGRGPASHSTVGLETSQMASPAQFLWLSPQRPFLLTCWLTRTKYISSDELTSPLLLQAPLSLPLSLSPLTSFSLDLQ